MIRKDKQTHKALVWWLWEETHVQEVMSLNPSAAF